MAEERKQIVDSSDEEPSIRPVKKQKKQTATANSTSVVTKTLLDDANNGYKNGNFACSPLSLDILLGMLAAGAEGETLKQLLEFLGHKSIDKFHAKSPSSKLLRNKLPNPKTGLRFNLANGVWVDKKVGRVQTFLNLSTKQKRVLSTLSLNIVVSLKFGSCVKGDEAVEEINSWVNMKTKGLIPSIVEKSDLDDQESAMVIANALYFKGKWSNPFSEEETRGRDFRLINGEYVYVPFMAPDEDRFDYGSFEDYKMIRLPYKSDEGKSNQFSMYIFLPHEKDGLKKLLQTFHSNDALFHGEFDLTRQRINEIWIPKFKISCRFEPKYVMQQMGLTLPFEVRNRELSGIVKPGVMLHVSKILQKSFIQINERGTEAGAGSAMITRTGCCASRRGPPPLKFVAKHPFMFMIREDSSRAVLFVGVVINPLVNN